MQNVCNGRQILCLFPNVHYQNRMNAFDFFLPSRALQSEKESALFMKKLITVALSNMLKFRGVFPESCFLNYGNSDHDAFVLDASQVKGRKSANQATYVIKRLVGLFDAIDRKYVKELAVRLLSQGNGKNEDGIEQFTFHFSYGLTPLITMKYNGELASQASVLMSSVNTLLQWLEDMGETLPPLSNGSNPHLTIWMNKTEWAPPEWTAPGYPCGPLYGPVTYPPMYEGFSLSNDVTTGFHNLKISYKFSQGKFGDLELFQRYYGNQRRTRRRVVELTSDESFDNETADSRSEKFDDDSDESNSISRYSSSNRFESLSAVDSSSDEESENNYRRRNDTDNSD